MSWPERIRSTASCTARMAVITRSSKTPGQASVSKTWDSSASLCRPWAVRRSITSAPLARLELIERIMSSADLAAGTARPGAGREEAQDPRRSDMPRDDVDAAESAIMLINGRLGSGGPRAPARRPAPGLVGNRGPAVLASRPTIQLDRPRPAASRRDARRRRRASAGRIDRDGVAGGRGRAPASTRIPTCHSAR